MDGELLSLKWNNHRTTFLQVIGTLRSKASYTDATIACEGKFYPVHKLVLSTCSEYFGAIFERTPCKSPVVVLKDIECKNLEFLLDYMYIGEVNVRQNELAALIKAAECLRIKGLAVPDEDPLNHYSSKGRSDSQRESSPPAKRRRNVQSSSVEKKQRESVDSASDNVGLERASSKDVDDSPIDESVAPIKLEPLDDTEVSNFLSNSNISVNDRVSDEGGGGESAREDSTSEMQEFFGAKVETEEQVHLGDYPSTDFAGPSGVQNSNLPPWDSENSFPSDHLLATTSSSQLDSQQQQQQQQLHDPEIRFEDVGEYPCQVKDCYVMISSSVPGISVDSVKKDKKRGRRRLGKQHNWSKKVKKYLSAPVTTSFDKEEGLPQSLSDNLLETDVQSEWNVPDVLVTNEGVNLQEHFAQSSNTFIKVNKAGRPKKNKALPLNMGQTLSDNSFETNVKSEWNIPNVLVGNENLEEPLPQTSKKCIKIKKEGRSKKKKTLSMKMGKKKIKLSVAGFTAMKLENAPKTQDQLSSDSNGSENKMYDVNSDNSLNFSESKSLNKLNKKHYYCGHCTYSTVFKKCLSKHELKAHPNEKRYNYCCSICDFVTNRKQNLTFHIKNNHMEKKPFACTMCTFRSGNKTSLKAHLFYMHSASGIVKKYRCNKCSYATNRLYNLNAHQQGKHTGRRPFDCSKCECKFFLVATLKKHEERIHRDDNSVCKVCEKQTSKLEVPSEREVETTSVVNVLNCKRCGFQTESPEALKEHKEIEHAKTLKIKKVYSIKKDREYMLRENKDEDYAQTESKEEKFMIGESKEDEYVFKESKEDSDE